MTLEYLLTTKTFWLTFIDVMVRLLNLLGKKFWPKYVDTINEIWLILQPLVLLFIAVFAVNDVVVPTLAAHALLLP